MKLVRYGLPGEESPAVFLENGNLLNAREVTPDFDTYFFENGGINELFKYLDNHPEEKELRLADERLGPPIVNPSKIICVGLNYAKHAEESGLEVPSEPVLFFKSTTAITGPYDDVIIPKNSLKTDWEVELAVVVGKKAQYVSEESAMDYVAGYLLHNDVSERAFQLEQGGQWVKGKSCDTFAPIGPYLVTKDEIPDPHNLDLWLKVNGEVVQSSNTSDLIFGIPHLVSYISQYMTLLPGDIISTGTPFGVGLGFDPPRYLKAGDTMELGIEGLGVAKQNVVPFSAGK